MPNKVKVRRIWLFTDSGIVMTNVDVENVFFGKQKAIECPCKVLLNAVASKSVPIISVYIKVLCTF